MPNLKIAIGIPTNRLIKPKTALSLLQLVAHSKYDYEIIVSSRGFNTSENRNYIAAQAVNRDCSHLFFVDDDQVFEPDTLDRLLARNKDIVGTIYNTKYEIQTPNIEYLDENKPTGFFKCKALGTGCLLIKTDVFKKIPQNYKGQNGWFNYIWNDNGSVRMSHDWLFCHNARECGFDIWADETIKVGHIGLKIF